MLQLLFLFLETGKILIFWTKILNLFSQKTPKYYRNSAKRGKIFNNLDQYFFQIFWNCLQNIWLLRLKHEMTTYIIWDLKTLTIFWEFWIISWEEISLASCEVTNIFSTGKFAREMHKNWQKMSQSRQKVAKYLRNIQNYQNISFFQKMAKLKKIYIKK